MQEGFSAHDPRSPRWSLLGRFFDALPIGAALSLDGKTTYANPVCLRMFGSREGEGVLNVSFFQLIDPDFHEFVIRLWNLRAGNSDPWTYALYGKRIDGSDFPYRCTSVSLNMPDQKATFVYLIDLSVVAAPPTREELHAENARLLTELEERADT